MVKLVALATSLVVLVLTIGMCAAFEPDGERFQFVEQHDWISAFGVQYAVGVDGIALVLIALVAVLVPVVLLASWTDADTAATPCRARSAAPGRRRPLGQRARHRADRRCRSGAAAARSPCSRAPDGDGDAGRRGRPRPSRSVKTFFALCSCSRR